MSEQQRSMPVALLEQIYRTLLWYGNRTTYMAPRIGGVAQGCPRGQPPDIDDLVAPALELLPKMEQAYRAQPVHTETGTVDWFNDAKGFGYIHPDSGGDSIFAHFSQILGEGLKTLKGGEHVRFSVTRGPKGRQATHIERLAEPQEQKR